MTQKRTANEAALSTTRPQRLSTGTLLSRFQNGDILFGLTQTSDRYVRQLKERFTYVRAFEINNPSVEKVVTQSDTNEYTKTLSGQSLKHFNLLKQARPYLTLPGGKHPWPSNSSWIPAVAIAIRRACKLIIYSAKQQGRHIHFNLDGISLYRVVDKQDNGVPDVSITSAELRAAYRHRDIIAGHITFYRGGKPCAAPWDKHAKTFSLWQRYHPKSNIDTIRQASEPDNRASPAHIKPALLSSPQ